MQQLIMSAASKRLLAGQQFIQHHAQRKNVAAAIQPVSFATGLLGTHVGRSASQPTVLEVILFFDRQSKVSHIRCGFRTFQQNIGRFHVSVN